MNYSQDISNMSYTNKDFNSIYVDLLEYAKKISYKWDPTASDEGDPGVVLLKLAALIADKDSYNIDKNILELMPASVTQLPAARQLFEQCGYSMKHYQSADGIVNLTFKKLPSDLEGVEDTSDMIFTLPRFTMFSDADSETVYTSTETKQFKYREEISIPVIEGSITEYTINNDPLITLNNLDSRNRLYFTDINVAQNGIFICNSGTQNYDEWKRVDNLEVEKSGSTCYKFGITLDGSACYIEFPDDITLLFGEGINVSYIRTSGRDGNISARRINKFFVDTKVTDNSGVEYILTSDNVKVYNPFNIINGKDPENIDEAYKSYKRVKETFDTLVSLKDYRDYMVTSNYASNGFVCDRTNDIQHSFTIIDTDGSLKSYVDVNTDGSPKMTAFDLKVFALKYNADISDKTSYQTCFDIDTLNTYEEFLNEDDSVKSIQHDFVKKDNGLLFLKNKYVVNAHIIPKQKLTGTEQFSIKQNIITTLYSALNSRQVNFGEEISYDLVYNTIQTSDERIKALSLEPLEYETYAVVLNGSEIKEVRVDTKINNINLSETSESLPYQTEIFAKNVLCGNTPLYVSNNQFNHNVTQTNVEVFEDVNQVTATTTISPVEGEENVFKVRKNESIVLSAPNYVEENNFSTYTKVVRRLSGDIGAEQYYNLGYKDSKEEFIIFFWKASSSDEVYSFRKYTASGDVNIIQPSQSFPASSASVSDDVLEQLNSCLTDSQGKLTKSLTITVGNDTINVNDLVSGLTSTTDAACDVLIGNQVIKTYKKNTITINNPKDGAAGVYWILNTVDSNNKCVLFNSLDANGAATYTLQSGEYFLYTNAEKTSLYVLGQGTKLEVFNSSDETLWSCKKIEYSDLLSQGIDFMNDRWVSIPTKNSEGDLTLNATEQQQIHLGSGSVLELLEVEDGETVTISSTETYVGTQFRYKTSDDELSFTDSPALSDEWSAVSKLHLEISKDNPLTLQQGQEIIISKDTTDITLPAGKVIQSDKTISVLGGENIYLINPILKQTTSLLCYTPTAENVTETSVSTAKVTSGKDFKFTVIPGCYAIHITPQPNTFKFKVGETTKTDNSIITGAGIYVFDVSNSEGNVDVTINLEGSVSEFTIKALKRIDLDKTNVNFVTGNLATKLNTFPHASTCDYLYKSDNLIENPLDSRSFFKSNHFYNQYTIGQWKDLLENDEDYKTIVVTNSIR